MMEKSVASAEINDFRDLIIWQKAILFAKHVYVLTKKYPRDERFGLTNQLRRAAYSVSSNIAEGHARQGREFAHFLSIEHGSLAECQSPLIPSVHLEFTSNEEIEPLLCLASEIHRMIASLSNKLSQHR